jgi:signal transduction histidine kinase
LRVPIRMKLAGALVVPLVALVIVTVLEVLDTYSDVDEVHDQAELATSTIGTPSLLSKLEDERNAAAIYLLDLQDAFALPVEDNADAWRATDQAFDEFRADVEQRGGGVAAAYGPALDAMGGLDDVRASVEGFDGERGLDNMDEVARAFDDYTAIMDTLFAANRQVIVTIHDTELRQGAELADLSARQTDLLARLVRDLMVTTLSGDQDGVNQQTEVATIGRELGLLRNNENLIRTKARGAYRPLAESLFADDDVQRFPELVRAAIETGTFDLLDVAEASAGDDADSFGYTAFRNDVTAELERQASAAQDDADQRLQRYIALAALATLAALGATWLVSRSITRPLRSLTGQAKEMAGERLPSVVLDILQTPLGDDVQVPVTVPVTVRTRDEVADVAAALNTVQDTAVDLAAEQAVLRRNIADSFVNLGRRNQNLLGRQLDFITELESNETHPETLASLFRLDHLATRMRRNAESLLVLAGIDPPRKWAAPVRINDVIRSALGEVEDYQRVVVRGVEPTTVVGSAAADLSHLLAELVENALVFSPGEQAVEIRGAAAGPGPDGAPGGYRLAVIDSGFGMDASDLAQANLRLVGDESFTIAPSKYLGHYVAGNLAERHGIRIHLDTSPGGGITASVDLPAALLTPEAAATLPEPVPEPVLELSGAPAASANGTPLAWGAVAERTAGGLAKRTPRPPSGAHGLGPTLPSDDLLASLRRHADNLHRSRPPAPPRPPVTFTRPESRIEPFVPTPEPPPPPVLPTADTGATVDTAHTTESGLARRVRGAQLPVADPRAIRRGGDDSGPAASADDVYQFLSSFTTGVQRGLDQARNEDGNEDER